MRPDKTTSPLRSVRPGRLGVALAAVLVVLAAAWPALAQPSTTTTAPTTTVPTATGDVPTLAPGTLLVSLLRAGRVEIVGADGAVTGSLVTGLNAPRGVAVQRDGAVLIAEYGADRIVGIGGRYGATLTEVAKLPTPDGLIVAPSGAVYATSLNEGTVVRVDPDRNRVTPIASGLRNPAGLTIRAGVLFVPEGSAGEVVSLTLDGAKTVVASNLGQPFGVATGPGKVLFVTDFRGNRLVRIADDGTVTDLAKLTGPVQVLTDPVQPRPNQPFTIFVTTGDGLVQLDQSGAVQRTTRLEVPVGVAQVPAPVTTPAGGGASTTTRVAPTTTLGTEGPRPTDGGAEGGTLPALIFVGVLAVAAVVAFVKLRPTRGSAQAGFDERPLDIVTVQETFGPCAGEEVALAEAEGGLRSVVEQREAAQRREEHAILAVDDAEQAVARSGAALAAAVRVREEAVAAGDLESAEPRELTADDLELHSDEGRAVLDALERGELTRDEAGARWADLGEDRAAAVLREELDRLARSDPDGPWPDEVAAQQTAREAEATLLAAERDLAEARADLARFREREVEATEKVAQAKERLAACQAKAEAERREAAKAAVRAELATGATAAPPGAGADADGDADADAGPDAGASEATGPEGSTDGDAARADAADAGGMFAAAERVAATREPSGDEAPGGDALPPPPAAPPPDVKALVAEAKHGKGATSPKGDAPKGDAPKGDAPPKPKADAPAEPKVDAPKADAPAGPTGDAPKADAPAGPTGDAPKADAPAGPKGDAPKTDAPAAPKTDAPAAPTGDAPKADAPDEPKTDAPTEPKTDAPAEPTAEAADASARLLPEGDSPRFGRRQRRAAGDASTSGKDDGPGGDDLTDELFKF